MKTQTKNTSCRPVLPDPRDRKFTRLAFGAPSLPVFPKTLGRKLNPIKDQGASLACTAHATSEAAEYQDGILLSAAWTWMQECKRLGTYVPNGADPRTAMKVGCDLGFLPEKDAPFHFPEDANQIGNWTLWPDVLTRLAEPQLKAAYVPIPKVGDWFDNIRAALLNGRKENKTVMAFARWYASWNSVAFLPSVDTNDATGGHAFLFADFDTINGVEYLKLVNSWGTQTGDNGVQFMPRETANRIFSEWGSGLFVYQDLSPEDIEAAKQETPIGFLWRTVLQIWAKLMLRW